MTALGVHSVARAHQAPRDTGEDRLEGVFHETRTAARCLPSVIRRHVLAAVDAGVAAGSDDAARAALGRVDWILRGRARRRFEQALIDAALATGVLVLDAPAAVRHVLRAAALIIRGRRDVDLADRDQVARAYEAAVVGAPIRVPIASIVAALITLTMVTAVATAAVFVATHGPPGVYTRPPPPDPIGAYRDGGAPRRDPAIEQALASDLAHLVVASDGGAGSPSPTGGEPAQLARALRHHPAFAAYGQGLQAAWRAMIDSIERSAPRSETDPASSKATSELLARVHTVTDQLAGAGLGYFLDPEIFTKHGHRHFGIFAYRVEQVAFVRAARERVRVLSLRRLDQLNVSLALLGMKPEQLRDPVVLLDQIEDHVRTQVLPVLAGRPYEVGDEAWNASPEGRAVAALAGEAIRRELVVALGADTASIERATARCDQLITASVRRHEAQHELDEQSALDYPRVLADSAGPLRGDDGRATPFALRARTELSAYLSQIASDMWLPELALWNLARHAFRRTQGTSAEAYVAVVVLDGLARRLHLASPGPALHDGAIDRDRLRGLVAPLASRSTAELRTAAAALWTELFGRKLVRMVDDERANPAGTPR